MRGGFPTALLLALSLGCGISISALLGYFMAQHYPDVSWWLVVLIGIGCMAPVLSVATWGLLVDPRTLKGRAERVEDSVENYWATEATSGMGTDVMLTLGLLTTIVSIGKIELPTGSLLLALLVLCMASFAIRYGIARRKGA